MVCNGSGTVIEYSGTKSIGRIGSAFPADTDHRQGLGPAFVPRLKLRLLVAGPEP